MLTGSKKNSTLLLTLLPLTLGLIYLIFPFLGLNVFKYLFFIFLILIPGSVSVGFLFFSKKESLLVNLIFGYPVFILFEFLLIWLGQNSIFSFLPFLSVGFSMHGLYLFKKNINGLFFRKDLSNKLFYLVFLIFISLVLFLIAYEMMTDQVPSQQFSTLFYQDRIWNLGNIWSIIHGGYPLQDIRFVGQPLGYHLLQSYHHAFIYIFTNIDPLFIQNFLSPIFDSFILVTVLVLGLSRLKRLSENSIIILTLGIFFTEGVGWTYSYHLLAHPLTFYFSLLGFFPFMFTIYSYFKKEIELKIIYLSFLFAFLAAVKPTLVFTILPAMGIVFLKRLIFSTVKERTGQWKSGTLSEFFLGILLIASTFLIKYMIFPISRPFEFQNGNTDSRVYRYLIDSFHSIPKLILDIFFDVYMVIKGIPDSFLNWSGVSFLLLIIFFPSFRKENLKSNNFIIFVFGFIFAGLIANNVVILGSKDAGIYFVWYSMLIVLFLAIETLPFIENLNQRTARYILAFLYFVGVIFFARNFIFVKFWDAWPSAANNIKNAELSIDSYEFEAMQWLKNNGSQKELVLSHRRGFFNKTKNRWENRFFAYSALSGRQFLIEGEDFNFENDYKSAVAKWTQLESIIGNEKNPVVTLDKDLFKNFLSSYKIKYFIQSLRFNQMDFTKADFLKLVFENPSIKIYKFNQP